MTLPTKAVDRLFERLSATYGAQWQQQWASVPITDVKSVWAHELSRYAGNLSALAWALENLPERCPNAIQFKTLCRSAPSPELPKLPEPKADPERLKQELAKLGDLRAKALTTSPLDHKAWARRIMGRYEGGEKLNPTAVRFAREALHLDILKGNT